MRCMDEPYIKQMDTVQNFFKSLNAIFEGLSRESGTLSLKHIFLRFSNSVDIVILQTNSIQ
jgi:hypothetical protein